MAEIIEEEKVEVTGFKDFVGGQDYIDHVNALKSKWAGEFREKESKVMKEKLREELTLELNPAESEDQKRLRAIELELKDSKDQLAKNVTIDKLRLKAKEIGFDQSRAERYAAYGEDGEVQLLADHEYFNKMINTKIDAGIGESFGKIQPGVSDKVQKKLSIDSLKGKTVDEIRLLRKEGLIEGL